jgi:F420-dependent oxidoreductase-like protein
MTSVRQVLDEALWAASAGFDHFWVSQIFGVDSIVALASVAASVPELKEMGTSVVPLPGRHPLALAASARTAQSALDGRFVLGVGPSHAMVSEGFFGEPYDRPFSRTEEFLAALVPLLRGEPADVAGEQIETHGWLTIDADPCPVLLAALGPRMLDLAARLTQGTILGFCGPRTIADHIAPTINAAAERARRPPPRIVAHVVVAVTDDPELVHADGVEHGALYDTLPSYRRVLDREGVRFGADLWVTGSVSEVEAGLSAYVEAGATELRVSIDSSDPQVLAATRSALTDLLTG